MQNFFSVIEDDHSSSDMENEKPALQKQNTLRRKSDLADLSDPDDDSIHNVKVDDAKSIYLHKDLVSKKIIPEIISKKNSHSPSGSEESDGGNRQQIPGGYNAKLYENLDINDEEREILQYVTKYTPQQLNLDHHFKSFIPDYIPAVGDIDAFLKVYPPETTVGNEKFNEKSLELGLKILDEPAANQSDPALLFLQLKAATDNVDKTKNFNVVVKKVTNIEQNGKIIDKWIKDVSNLHKGKSFSVLRCDEEIPDLNDLMQQWSDEMENKLKQEGFPKPQKDTSLVEYIKVVSNIFDIPLMKKEIHSVYLIFCLYAGIKQTQLYRTTVAEEKTTNAQISSKNETDQLILD